jgi:hypothetical protein
MATIKDRLIEHIEAYSIAKASANAVLVSLSAAALKQLIDGLRIEEAPPVASDDFSAPEIEPTSRPRGRKVD